MFDRRNAIRSLALIAAITLTLAPAFAQTDLEINAAVQFNFSTPGARSLGLGGAFLGIADDATTAYTNPAGLINLSRPEVSAEYRAWDYTHVFTDHGNVGEPTNLGVDTVSGLQNGEGSDSVSGASFASFVYPGKTWAVAVYRHELARFEATNFSPSGAFSGNAFTDEFGFRYFPVQASLELDITGFGVAGAFRIGDSFSIGVGAARYTLELDSRTDRYNLDVFGDLTAPGGFFGEPLYTNDNFINRQIMSGDDDDVAFQGGFLWTGSKVSVGGVYRQGPEFEFLATNFDPDLGTVFQEGVGSYHVPDFYGLGLAVHPTDTLTISLDVNQVTYSNLTENNLNVIGCDPEDWEFCNPDPEFGPSPAESDSAAALLEVDDATEIHLGLEYVFANIKYPLALRVGGFNDPDHLIAMPPGPSSNFAETSLANLFRPGDDELHYSLGLGVVFGEKFQIDVAADFSDRIDTTSISGVFRF
jgi:long-chain fatty acid transport protein